MEERTRVGRLEDRRAEDLIGKRPVIGRRPAGEIARSPHRCRHDEGVFRPRGGVGGVDGYTDVHAAADWADPAICGPAGEALGRRVSIDAQSVCDEGRA